MSEISCTKPISVADFSKICRICFGIENLFPIFELIIDNIIGTNLLASSVNLQVTRGDNLPENICETCLKELCKIYKFKRQCRENDSLLKMLIRENNEKIKVEDVIKIEVEERDPLSEINDIQEVDDSSGENTDTKLLPYECQYCNKGFETPDEFHIHKYEVVSCKSLCPCKLCNKVLRVNTLSENVRFHTKRKSYQCHVCSQSFTLWGDLVLHKKIHSGERPHICDTCGKGFEALGHLNSHVKSHRSKTNDSPNFTCEQCGRTFKRLVWYNTHLETHASDKKIVKNEDDEFPTADPIREYVCEICTSAYETKYQLKRHALMHGGGRKFVCDKCGECFTAKASLHSHIRTHTGERPYECGSCDRSFAHLGSLKSHMLIHSGRRPHACGLCPKAFTQVSQLKYHLRTHSGEKNYKCRFCGRAFSIRSNMKVHERKHTGEKPHVCRVCERGFSDFTSFKRHVKKHVNEQER